MSSFQPLPDVKSGDPIKADLTNKQSQAINRLNIQGGPNALIHPTPNGLTIEALGGVVDFWARIVDSVTVNGVTYFGWIELIPQPGGKWIDGYRLGKASATDGTGATEMNGNTSVPVGKLGDTQTGGTTQSSGGVRVLMQAIPGCACYVFQYAACPTS